MTGCNAIYSADFETTTNPEDCRVWAWGFSDIDKPEDVKLGNSLDTFMDELKENGGTYYFHNLKFDGNFILFWLFTHGYKWVQKKSRELEPNEFTTLISDMGTWYTITIRMAPKITGISHVVEIRDSLKLIPLPVADIPKAYGLEESKLYLDYNTDREVGHELTTDEIAYIRADIIIVAKAIKFMRENKQTKLTAASNALNDFKSRYDNKTYNRLFPELNHIQDKDIRKSYKGGWTYLNPKYRNKEIADGAVYDVNSMYPWAMKYCLLPWGKPCYFSGKYKASKNYPLYVQSFVTEFRLKPGHYPSIQIKGSVYAENEYIVNSIMPTVLTLTNVDYELFKENYDFDESTTEYLGGYMFHAKHGMFTEYVDDWYETKTDSKIHNNKGMEKIAKLMLNSLYGKFGSRISGKSKIPYYDEQANKVRYKKSEEEARKGGYLPVATFITSYCRDKIIRAANICGDRFIYADTDSVHVLGTDPIQGLDVDEYRLGAFKQEEVFIRGRFIRQKTYLEVYLKGDEEKVNLKCCGMPDSLKKAVSEDEFVDGAIFDIDFVNRKNQALIAKTPDISPLNLYKPKLMPQVVSGGVVLGETTFQIKSRSAKLKNEYATITDDSVFVRTVKKKSSKARSIPEFTVL